VSYAATFASNARTSLSAQAPPKLLKRLRLYSLSCTSCSELLHPCFAFVNDEGTSAGTTQNVGGGGCRTDVRNLPKMPSPANTRSSGTLLSSTHTLSPQSFKLSHFLPRAYSARCSNIALRQAWPVWPCNIAFCIRSSSTSFSRSAFSRSARSRSAVCCSASSCAVLMHALSW